jgi:hypothetical protein
MARYDHVHEAQHAHISNPQLRCSNAVVYHWHTIFRLIDCAAQLLTAKGQSPGASTFL